MGELEHEEAVQTESSLLPGGATLTVTPATKRSTQNVVTLNQQSNVRVAAYCRVSTEESDQENSFMNQKEHYENYIKEKDGWVYAGVYADDGISGMSVKGRFGFQQLIADAKAGKFDYIITKSISRFSRNTIDGLTTINELRTLDPPVGVYFEKENLDTLQPGSEFLLSVMMSLAQGESDSIGENIQWTYRKKFAAGQPLLKPEQIYGFKSGPADEWLIDEEKAAVVRRIYESYAAGKATTEIADELTAEHVPPIRRGKRWYATTIQSILSNEKYKGDVQMQKYVTIDRKAHIRRKNNGEAKTYYVENHHPAIVSKELWDICQKQREANKKLKKPVEEIRPFSIRSLLYCGECGAHIRLKNVRRTARGYKDERSTGLDATNYIEEYFFRAKLLCCPSDHVLVYRFTLEQSFMEMLYTLKRDYEKYGDASDLAMMHVDALDASQNPEETEKQYQDFLAKLLTLPERNSAGVKMNVNGLDSDGTIMRTADGKVIKGAYAAIMLGRLKITEDKITLSPDILPYDSDFAKYFIESGTVYSDHIIYKTTFGLNLRSLRTDRKLDAFMGYRKYKEDGTPYLIMDTYETVADVPQYNRIKREKPLTRPPKVVNAG